jgi:nicotinamide riboside transporter PnuC
MMLVLTVLSFIGIVLNIQKKRSCFLIWGITNAAWAVIDFKKDIPAQGWLLIVYTALAVWGWFSWSKHGN